VLANASIHFPAMDRDLVRRRESEPDFVAAYRDDGHTNVVSKKDLFTNASTEN